jgi:hypothetical protein
MMVLDASGGGYTRVGSDRVKGEEKSWAEIRRKERGTSIMNALYACMLSERSRSVDFDKGCMGGMLWDRNEDRLRDV